MGTDKKLEQQFIEYQNLAKESPNIDVGSLMLSALQNQKQNMLSKKQKRLAYLVSLSAPPFGLFFAFKFFFAGEDDAKTAAWTCIFLTLISLILIWVFGKLFFSGSGASLNQIQQIKPQDIQQLYQ